jgi:hypothetical protein
MFAGLAGGLHGHGLPRLDPNLAETWDGELEPVAARRATIVYVLARRLPGFLASDFRLDITDRSIVRQLAEALGRSAPLEGPGPDPGRGYAVLFGTDAGAGGLVLAVRYDLEGVIAVGPTPRRYRASRELRDLLNPRIEEREGLYAARDRFLQAVVEKRWADVAEVSSPELTAEIRDSLLPELEKHELALSADGIRQWRETTGTRTRKRLRQGVSVRDDRPVHGFVGRLRPADRGPSWWIHVLLVREPDRWQVADLKLKRSGSKHGGYR